MHIFRACMSARCCINYRLTWCSVVSNDELKRYYIKAKLFILNRKTAN